MCLRPVHGDHTPESSSNHSVRFPASARAQYKSKVTDESFDGELAEVE